jgi:hypothetical protein
MLSAWFVGAQSLPIREEALGLGRFGRILTILHCPRLGLTADGHEDEDETDEEIVERWTPRFR